MTTFEVIYQAADLLTATSALATQLADVAAAVEELESPPMIG